MPRRTKNQRRADKQRIVDMILRGKTGVQIAAVLNISQAVASKEIIKIEDEWKAARFETMDVYKKKELEHLNFLYQEAINGWERSLKESEKKRQRVSKRALNAETVEGVAPYQTQAEVTKEERAGDPRFLQVAKGLREDIRQLLGIVQVTELKLSTDIPPSPEEARKELAKILAPYGIDAINITKDESIGSGKSIGALEIHHEH
jgi:hypothetical protein